jgi:heterodisulfide reductase subunit C
MCSRCYTCYALCPQGVKFSDVLDVLRDLAIKEGYVPKERYQKARELDKFIQDLRCDIINSKLHPDDVNLNDIKTKFDTEVKVKW